MSSQVRPVPIAPLAIRAYTATTALGRGGAAQAMALRDRQGGLRRNDFQVLAAGQEPLACWIGRVDGLEDEALPAPFARWDCRNNRLAWVALQHDGVGAALDEVVARHGADRVAVVLGTSTASIAATEEAYARLDHGTFPADLQRPIVHTPHS